MHKRWLSFIQDKMLVQKKNFEDFYNEIRDKFPKMRDLDTWQKYDWSLHGYENSAIMTELSSEMANWMTQGKELDVQQLMTMVERYFDEGDVSVISIIYSDFLVTIMETKKEAREKIKGMMGPETRKNYKRLLDFYRESDM